MNKKILTTGTEKQVIQEVSKIIKITKHTEKARRKQLKDMVLMEIQIMKKMIEINMKILN